MPLLMATTLVQKEIISVLWLCILADFNISMIWDQEWVMDWTHALSQDLTSKPVIVIFKF